MSMSSSDPRQFTAQLRALRQHRKFSSEPVPTDVLNDILEVARWSGSSKNSQPWEFIVVRDREKIQVIAGSGTFSGFLAGANVVIVVVLHGEGHTYDEGRVSERILLAADAYGLSSGTGWFSTPDAWEPVRQLLNIPEDRFTHQALGIGYPDTEAVDPVTVAAGRRRLDDLVRYETYDRTTS